MRHGAQLFLKPKAIDLEAITVGRVVCTLFGLLKQVLFQQVQTGDMKRRPGIEGATGCPSWCRPLRPLFHFLDDVSYQQSVLLQEERLWHD